MMRFHSPKYLLILTLVLAAVVVFLVGSAPTYSADHNLVHSELDSQQTSCRYGSAAPPDDVWVDELGIGWTIDFGASPRPFLPDVEYVPIIRIKQSRSMDDTRIADYYLTSPPSEERLVELLERFPGRIWQVGNEVDRIWWQDDIMPDVYATAYHELYHLIKKHDPTALVAPSALVQVTPGRLQYLDIVWDTYQEKYGAEMPVDVWNMHIYILPERSLTNPGSGSRAGIALGTDPDLAIYDSGNSPDPALCPRDDVYCYAEHDSIEIFKEQAIAMRRWMKERGEQDKPLILTEFSILYPYKEETDPDYDPETCPDCFSLQDEYGEVFSRTRVLEYMNQTLNFLETATDPELGYPEDNYRLVQQWNWFSVYSVTPGSPNNLLHDDKTRLTVLGENYKRRIIEAGFHVNLHAVESTPDVVNLTNGGAPIAVTFRNNGNTSTESAFQVTFYSDEALTQEIGSVIVPQGVTGCATRPFTAGISWEGVGPGWHHFWARLDSGNQLGETNEGDNIVAGAVFVYNTQMFLPFIQH